ncbi:MAG: DUF1592 domain-containing protein [Akkermansiaceae bacterium]|nr:DUF1592 domain-containing protein [Akkermansiaceae bacterium]
MTFRAILFFLTLAAARAAEPAFDQIAKPFIGKHCVECHGPEKQKGKLRLDTLPVDFSDPHTASKWKEVVTSVSNHEMPPEDEPQPPSAESAAFAGWLEARLGEAEIAKRSSRVVMRRMNRAEYNNTIRDLLGVDFRPADQFPEDPPAGGFDNIGQALTMSPMQMELYYNSARQILDRALAEGEKPAGIKWRFEPEENTAGPDKLRVKRDGNNILLNDGNNPTEGGFTVIHHDSWDKTVGFRDFAVPVEGEYIIRFRAAGRVPDQGKFMASVEAMLAASRDARIAKEPGKKDRFDLDHARLVEHFRTDRIYDFGPPRLKVTQQLGSQPEVIAEMDVDATEAAPRVYELRRHFTTQRAGMTFAYAYEIPRKLENFAIQNKPEFARPELLLDWIELEGPIHPVWPPASHTRVLFDSPLREKDEAGYAREVLARFMARAYRRPVTAEEIDGRLALFTRARPEKPSFVEAVKVPLAAILASPHFLYLVEPEAPAGKARPLAPYELASRLSYFLWSSMPDETLFRLAGDGTLARPEVLGAQVDRMLADPRSAALVENFAGQWLGLRKVGANPPSKTLYPEYDRHLEISVVREAEGFFSEILRHDLDVRNFIRSGFVTINERLARFYGIPGVKGDAIRRVPVPEGVQRGGLVTLAAMHGITSNGTRTSPVVRGTWVLKTLLGTDPGLPVANVGEIQPTVPGIGKATVRQRLAIHREVESCARCHDKIDPLGLALENFDACGKWREQEGHGYNGRIEKNDPVIDASAKMPDGTEFTGVRGLQDALLEKDDLFLNALATQLTTYALGRELGFSDRPAIRSFTAAMRKEKNTLRSLIKSIVTSESFITK